MSVIPAEVLGDLKRAHIGANAFESPPTRAKHWYMPKELHPHPKGLLLVKNFALMKYSFLT